MSDVVQRARELADTARCEADNAEGDSWPWHFDVGLTRRLADGLTGLAEEVERLRAREDKVAQASCDTGQRDATEADRG